MFFCSVAHRDLSGTFYTFVISSDREQSLTVTVAALSLFTVVYFFFIEMFLYYQQGNCLLITKCPVFHYQCAFTPQNEGEGGGAFLCPVCDELNSRSWFFTALRIEDHGGSLLAISESSRTDAALLFRTKNLLSSVQMYFS